jgi:hypothetical protein
MVSMSMLGARAGTLARLMSVTYARGLIRLLNSTKTRPIAAYTHEQHTVSRRILSETSYIDSISLTNP